MMPPDWKIIFYEDDDGYSPVEGYITEGNDPRRKALLISVIELLVRLGPDIQGTNMDKLIEGSIRELRKGRHRILYGRTENRFVLLAAFMKKTDKTPADQIELAKRRFVEYKMKNKQVPK